MPAAAKLAFLLVALPLVALGCRPALYPVDKGSSLYDSGDYEDAADVLADAEQSYATGELPPDYALRYLAYRGLALHALGAESGDKSHKRRARPLIRRALDRYESEPKAKEEGWLDDKVVEALRAASKGASPQLAAEPDPQP